MPNPRFVLIPRRPRDVLLGAPDKRLNREERSARMDELREARGALPAVRDLERWLVGRPDVAPGFCTVSYAKAGAVVLELDERQLEHVRGEVDVDVVEDVVLARTTSVLTGGITADADPAGLWHLDRLGVPGARTAGRVKDGSSVTVAVLDSGVDGTHPDLIGRVEAAVGRSDAGVFAREAESKDDNGHGTSIAGLIAGTRTGVAPAARVLPLRTTAAQRATLGELLVGWLPWLLANPDVDIVNMSLGLRRGAFSDGQIAAIDAVFTQLVDVGILPVAAVGNDGPGVACVPAVLDSVLAVGATNAQDRVWSSSGSGPSLRAGDPGSPRVVAPGVKLVSTASGGGYATWSGSSHAAAVASGLAALLLDHEPDLSVVALRSELVDRAVALGATSPERQGRGILQA